MAFLRLSRRLGEALIPPVRSVATQRFRSTGTGSPRHHSGSHNPYRILGIPPSSSFQVVHKTFLKLALQYHPDTVPSETKANAAAHFVRIRQAYERIRDSPQNLSHRKSYHPDIPTDADADTDTPPSQSTTWTETDFLQYFYEQTGVRLTSDQRRELVHLYRTRQRGGYYGGPAWELARRLVSEQDMFLHNMTQGGSSPPPGSSKSEGRRSNSFTSSSSGKDDASSSNNLRRRRKR